LLLLRLFIIAAFYHHFQSFNDIIISIFGVWNGALAAVLHSVLKCGEIPSAVIIKIQRAETKQAIDLFEFMAWIIFAICIGKPPVTILTHIFSDFQWIFSYGS